jgi:HK97 gp10 family phage protein
VKGLKELQAMLDTLPAKMEANIMRSALRAGANVVKNEAQANVPVDTGTLRKGLKVSTRLKRGRVTASVRATGKHGWLAHFLEFGTAAHVIKAKPGKMLVFAGGAYRAVNHPGIRPRPFLRPALDSKSSAALVAVGNQIKKRLTKQGLNAADIDIEVEE